MNFLISAIIGYLLGSFPTAFVVLKFSKGIDITEKGSGNVGAMNTFDVSKSKILGMLVLLIDALKGLLSVYICLVIFPLGFSTAALSLIFSVLSHCYNPWLKFKGGRGLATAAGGTLILFPVLLLTWCLIWAGIFLIKRKIIFANFFATVSSLAIIMIFLNKSIRFAFPRPGSETTLLFFSTALLAIILTRHFSAFVDSLNRKEGVSNERTINE